MYSAFNEFKTVELSNSFFAHISLKQPKLQFKILPWEDASQTAVRNQKEAQLEEKAVKYFIGRSI